MSNQVKVTGFMPVYDVISGCFPFVECILMALPLVDEMIICDGGSTDGTLEVIEKMASLDNRIKIVKSNYQSGKNWNSIDKSFKECLNNHVTGEWIIPFHADEYFLPKYHKKILETIQKAHEEGYNCIRHSMFHISAFEAFAPEFPPFNWRPVRMLRVQPNIRARDGIDSFGIEGEECYLPELDSIPGFYRTNLPPELRADDIVSYHVAQMFEYGELITNRRHTTFFGIESDPSRYKSYIEQKRLYNIDDNDENYDIESIQFKPIIPSNIHEGIPKLLRGLIGMTRYEVRDELFDMIKDCKKIKIKESQQHKQPQVRQNRVKITGITVVHNTLTGHLPSAECIALALPLVDELIIVDGGSIDGTLKIVKKFAELNKKIKIVEKNFTPGVEWNCIDEAFTEEIQKAEGDWIIAFHADEFFHPDDHNEILKAIQFAHDNGYNSIRQSLLPLCFWNYTPEVGTDHDWRPVRIFRKQDKVVSQSGMHVFRIHDEDRNTMEDTIVPELKETFISYHVQNIFPIGDFIRLARHVKFYAIDNPNVERRYNEMKIKLGIIGDSYSLTKIEFPIQHTDTIHERLPEIFHPLVNSQKYFFREELYEIIKNL